MNDLFRLVRSLHISLHWPVGFAGMFRCNSAMLKSFFFHKRKELFLMKWWTITSTHLLRYAKMSKHLLHLLFSWLGLCREHHLNFRLSGSSLMVLSGSDQSIKICSHGYFRIADDFIGSCICSLVVLRLTIIAMSNHLVNHIAFK
jgi:hypothetical protein